MRKLLRFVIFWAMLSPLFYFFGMPFLMAKMQVKVRTEVYTSCLTQLRGQGLIETQTSPLTVQQGDEYCHCASDGLTFTRADLFDAVRKQKPAHLTAQTEQSVNACTPALQEHINRATLGAAIPPVAAPTAPATNADGSKTFNF